MMGGAKERKGVNGGGRNWSARYEKKKSFRNTENTRIKNRERTICSFQWRRSHLEEGKEGDIRKKKSERSF